MEPEKEIDCSYTQELVCPYCGHEQSDSWEASEAQDDTQCGSCEKHFAYESEPVRYFTSWKVSCLNDGIHDFKPLGPAWEVWYPAATRCKMCHKTKWLKEEEKKG